MRTYHSVEGLYVHIVGHEKMDVIREDASQVDDVFQSSDEPYNVYGSGVYGKGVGPVVCVVPVPGQYAGHPATPRSGTQ